MKTYLIEIGSYYDRELLEVLLNKEAAIKRFNKLTSNYRLSESYADDAYGVIILNKSRGSGDWATLTEVEAK